MTRWRSKWTWLRDLVRGSRVEREIDEELRFHVEEELEAGTRRGLTSGEARLAACQSLGGTPLVVREQIRDARQIGSIDDVRRDVRHAVRLLRKSPAFSAVVVATLGVAIGAVVTAFSMTDAWLFRPLRFPDADRLVVAFAARSSRPEEPAVWMPYRAYRAFKDSAHTFSSVSAAFFHPATWRTAADAKSLVGMGVTPEFFSTFGVTALRGRTIDSSDVDGPPVVVLSHAFWRGELGGADAVVGTTVTLGDTAFTVIGIMPASFDVRLLDQREGAAFWTLLRTGKRGYEPGGMGPVAVVGRLAAGVRLDTARAEAAAIMRRSEAAYARNFNEPSDTGDVLVVNLSSLQADNTRTVRATLLTVLAAAVCLLLIASMNVGVLLLGRGLGRRAEVAVRHALGAGRARLIRQFLVEGMVLSTCVAALGIAVAVVATRLVLGWNPLGTLPANAVQLDLRVLLAATLATAVAVIVAGLAPAIRTSAAPPAAALCTGNGMRTTAPPPRAQGAMLVAQMAASTVLLICAALLARTFVQLRAEPLGFAAADVTVATVVLPTTPYDSGAARNAFYAGLEQQLASRPSVRAVAAATSPPLVAGAPEPVNLTNVENVSAPRMSTHDVTTGYFAALEIPLVAGRGFDTRDGAGSQPVVILNDRAARDLFGEPRLAIGRHVRLGMEPWREIIGVVGNVRTTFFNTLEWLTDPIVYRPAAQGFAQLPPMTTAFTLWVHVRATGPVTAADVRRAAMAAGPRAAVTEVQRAPELVAAATRQPTFRMTLLLWFCGVSLLLAAIGVYGMVTQTVTERLRDIAIRIALGAQPRLVRAMFVRKAITLGAVGLGIGVVLAATFARSLQPLLFGGRAGDAISVSVAALLLLGVTALAAWLPTVQATRGAATRLLRG